VTKKDFIELMHKVQNPLKGMIKMIPEEKVDWRPAPGFMSVGQVLKHVSENWVFLKMMITGQFPKGDIEEEMKLENLKSSTPNEAFEACEMDFNSCVAFIEKEISEEDFFNKVIEAPWGFKGAIWQAVTMLRDHQTNHKMQLHLYMKMLGLPVHTGTLYGM